MIDASGLIVNELSGTVSNEIGESFANEISGNLMSTGLTFITLLLIYIVGSYLLKKKTDDERVYERLKARLYYTLAGFFVFFLTKVWVEGFSHFFTILGVVSAALVITNKEVIMNLSGWLIINWRSLFTERDFIQIANHSGYVHELGLLYFKIYEGSKYDINLCTGRVIKIPNGLVIHNPIVNFSEKDNLMEYIMHWYVTYDSDYSALEYKLMDIATTLLSSQYDSIKKYTREALSRRNKFLASHITLTPHVHIKAHQSAPHGIKVSICFFCYPTDSSHLINQIERQALDYIQTTEGIELSLET